MAESSAGRTNWRVTPLAMIAIGLLAIALRAVWVLKRDRMEPIPSEMFYVARAWAETGQLADAYGPGTGLTAHVVPAMPLMAGAVYRLLGAGTPQAEVVLMTISVVIVGLTLWALDRAMKLLGAPDLARLAAFAAFLLIPLNFSLEMQNFRVWEGGVAALGIAAVLWGCLRLDQRAEPPSWRVLGLLALAGAGMALASPPAAIGMFGCLGLLAWRRRGFVSMIGAAALSAGLLVAVSYPWAERNAAVFGERVWSRTNFGFNFALGFHDGAVSPADPRQAFVDRLAEIDPYTSPAAYQAMKQMGGEQAYSDYWTARTKAWVAEHPAQSVVIAVRHIGDYFFPPRWLWSVYSDKATALAPRQALIWIITILAFARIGQALWRRDWRYLYVLGALMLPALPYLLAQPILRYRYTGAALQVYLAAELTWVLGVAVWNSGVGARLTKAGRAGAEPAKDQTARSQ